MRHRAHERAELRESLCRDAEQAIANAQSTAQINFTFAHWLTDRQQLIADALSAQS